MEDLQWAPPSPYTHIVLLPPWQARNHVAQLSLDKAINTCSWDNISRCIYDPDSAQDASHMLVHLRTSDDLTGCLHDWYVTTLASQYVFNKVYERAGGARAEHLRDLLMSTLGDASLDAIAGQFFERFAHDAIQKGGPFKASTLLQYLLGAPCNSCSWFSSSEIGVWALGVGCWVLPMWVDQPECCMMRSSLQQAQPPSQLANAFVFATPATGSPPVAT